jgi:hypothetical protein
MRFLILAVDGMPRWRERNGECSEVIVRLDAQEAWDLAEVTKFKNCTEAACPNS